VGFSLDTRVDQALYQSVRRLFDSEAAAASTAPQWLPTAVDAQQLARLWHPSTQLRLDDRWSPAQWAQAQGIVLQRYKQASSGTQKQARTGRVTLAEVWPQLNVQGRNRIEQGDLAFGAVEGFGEEADEFSVRFAIHGRGVQFHQQHGAAFFIGGPAGELGFLRVRGHADGKLGTIIGGGHD
jgi:hypothetical protein